MTKNFLEKAALTEKLRLLLLENTIIIHYACEPFNKGEHLMTICTRNISTGEARSFSVHSYCEGSSKKQIRNNYESYERKMLLDFAKYVQEHANYNWVGWNIRDDQFGLPHIEKRLKALCPRKTILLIPIEKKLDLGNAAWELYGSEYVPDPKLPALMLLNQITIKDLIPGKKEGGMFYKYSYRGYLTVNRSTLRKIDGIHNIMQKMANETIRVHPNANEKRRIEIELKGVWAVGLNFFVEAFKTFLKLYKG